MGIVENLHVKVADLRFVINFTVLDLPKTTSSYRLLLGRPWLKLAKVRHDWGTDRITLENRDRAVRVNLNTWTIKHASPLEEMTSSTTDHTIDRNLKKRYKPLGIHQDSDTDIINWIDALATVDCMSSVKGSISLLREANQESKPANQKPVTLDDEIEIGVNMIKLSWLLLEPPPEPCEEEFLHWCSVITLEDDVGYSDEQALSYFDPQRYGERRLPEDVPKIPSLAKVSKEPRPTSVYQYRVRISQWDNPVDEAITSVDTTLWDPLEKTVSPSNPPIYSCSVNTVAVKKPTSKIPANLKGKAKMGCDRPQLMNTKIQPIDTASKVSKRVSTTSTNKVI